MNNISDKLCDAAQEGLGTFAALLDKRFRLNWHHKEIIKALQKVERGEIKRLLISVPPRHGKSMLSSILFPCWFMGRNPDKSVMITSYSASLAEKFSRQARNIVASDEYKTIFPDVALAADSQSIKTWSVDYEEQPEKFVHGGDFIAAGVGGAITGKGFHLGIIDDPFSNREEADSEVIREKVWDWYTSTFYTRQEEGAAIIAIMTRWHEDDLIGRLLGEYKSDEWEVLEFPAIATSDEYIGSTCVRRSGEALWADKYPIDVLENIKAQIGQRDWEALYQQNPLNEGGGAFKKEYFKYYPKSEILTKKLNVVMFVDPAISLKESADYSAIVTIGHDEQTNNIYVLDVFRKRVEPNELIDEIFYRSDVFEPSVVGIEVVQFQKMLAFQIKEEMRIRNKFFFLSEITPMGEKEARILSALQPRYANRSILHPAENKDVQELEKELLRFPAASHDDASDAMSGAVKLISTVAPSSNKNKPKFQPAGRTAKQLLGR